jgi:hypothetical protein
MKGSRRYWAFLPGLFAERICWKKREDEVPVKEIESSFFSPGLCPHRPSLEHNTK